MHAEGRACEQCDKKEGRKKGKGKNKTRNNELLQL